MPQTSATILIPDISGFTAFMTSTELDHGSFAINMLIEAMVEAVGDAFEVSEIEGDAVLLIKKGPPPTRQELLDLCLKIFDAFHARRRWMQQYSICLCEACKAISNLTLKFVAHHGQVAEIKVGRFIKHSGTEMIVAHRLLKNHIDHDEYLLMTERLLPDRDAAEDSGMAWLSSSEEYPSIGKVDFRFTLLDKIRKSLPDLPSPEKNYRTDDTAFGEVTLPVNYFDAYMLVKDVPSRANWMPGLKQVEQDFPHAYIGSIHNCFFEGYGSVVSPLRLTVRENEILYAESCEIKQFGVFTVHEFLFRNTGEHSSTFLFRCLNGGDTPMPPWMPANLEVLAEALKKHLATGAGVPA